MSYTLMQSVVDTLGISYASKAVLMVLARHARDDGTNDKCPTVQTIGDKAGMCAKAARNALRALEADGWIRPVGNKSGGRCQTTNYVIVTSLLGPSNTRHNVPPNDLDTRHNVPPNGHDTRYDVPPCPAETRYDVPKNPASGTAEEVNEERKEGGGGSAHAHEVAVMVSVMVAGLTGLTATGRNVATVEAWLADGCDPQQDIYPAVLEVTAKATEEIGSFRYFTKAIGRHHAARTAPPTEKATGNVHPIRPAAAKQHRASAGRAGWRDQSLAMLADSLEEGD